MSENMRLRQGQEQRPQPTVDMLLDLCDDVNAGKFFYLFQPIMLLAKWLLTI